MSAAEAARLFADLKTAGTLVLAVSGGPDSTALLWLAARWRKRLTRGPKLVAVTIDHGLRKDAAREARGVGQLAASLGVDHSVLKWRGPKPAAGIPAAAREARYALLAEAAGRVGARCILTAHTQDDQAETFMMRLARGSGLTGLAAMARLSTRGDLVIARPFLDMPKARLIATLTKARVAFADDPTNRDAAFTRPRWRHLLMQLAGEGVDAPTISRLVARLAQANAALDAVTLRADSALLKRDDARQLIEERDFLTLPHEIRLRLLQRAINRAGREGPAELGKIETLLDDLLRAMSNESSAFKRTLAGAAVARRKGFVIVEPAPPRRSAKRL